MSASKNQPLWGGRPYKPRDYIKALVCGIPSVLRKERFLLMARGYVDASGNEPSKPHIVLAGFVSDVPRWEKFSDAWQAVLDKPPKIEYFKMQEANSLKGQFLHFDRDARDSRVMDFLAVIERHVAIRVHCSMGWEDYRSVFSGKTPRRFDDPYYLCFFHLMSDVMLFQVKNQIPEPVDFVFDEEGAIEQRALSWYDQFKKQAGPIFEPYLGKRPVFEDDKVILPLQAADMLAWHVRHFSSADSRDIQKEDRSVLDALLKIHGIQRHLHRIELEWLSQMSKNRRIKEIRLELQNLIRSKLTPNS
jgi:hypothetical protein